MPLKQKIELIDSEKGYLEKEERELMSSIFDFGDTVVREVMVPRIDMVAVNVHTDKDEALEVILEAGHSRVPVYDQTVDRIVGLIYTKDLLKKIISEEEFSLREITRKVFFVPESKNIDDLLTEFKKRKQHMAIAVDEYGGTAGLVTMEDVLEELVGDIQDEFDEEEDLVVRVDEDTAICNAKIRLDELGEMFGLEFDEDTVDTLGGLLYEKIGRVPRIGDVVSQEGLSFEIRSVLRQRIDKVLVKGLKSAKGVDE
jgi:CBS domain containing-hemolysin-like protein